MKLLDAGNGVSLALFLVFCGLAILGSQAERKLSKLGRESSAPENLRTVAERFRLKLILEQNTEIKERLSEGDSGQILDALEKNTELIKRISETESWSQLESNLSAYADRIELLTQQRRFMSALVHWALLASAMAMLAFSIARTRMKKRQEQRVADG